MKLLSFLTCLFLLSLSLQGCDTVTGWMGTKKEEKLAGTRIPVLRDGAAIVPDASIADEAIELPVPVENDHWTQRGATPANYAPNLYALTKKEADLRVVADTKAGDGNGWKLPLSIQPVVAGPLIYSMDASGNVTAHKKDAPDERAWTYQLTSLGEERFAGGGLAFANGKLAAVTGQGQVEVMNADTGKVLWQRSLRLPVRSAPKTDGKTLFIKTVDNQLFALNMETGTIEWKHQGIAEVASVMGASIPAIDGPIIVVAYSSGEIYGLDITNGREVWREMLISTKRTAGTSKLTDISASPVIIDGRVFVGSQSGLLTAIDASNGMRVWEREFAGVENMWVSGRTLFVITSDSKLVAVRGHDGRIPWIKDLPRKEKEMPWIGSMVLAGNIAVFSRDGRVLLFSTKGELLNTISWPKDIRQLPAAANASLYAVSDDATLHVMK